jgi:hypothetical protein
MCDLIVKEKFEKKLKENHLDEYFINVFGNNYTANKINTPGWWFQSESISFCVGRYHQEVKCFMINDCTQSASVRVMLKKMGYNFEYSFKDDFVMFLKENIIS